ncbi:hypothetical protein SanaruYs_08250 [Chryseotalea sanaruensis]|uniref:N-acetyltransferase domain-containing protein n=1 Tax=Chryseotalea sanaruensis TaxID=2482724 RepID=A0A401U6Z2_9BACT|nr:GNAT family N-acetyltransferase [Chryseotalea sanaruensis]GCC50610.1 hypothetical protein SanaruYs_08250 [Chryseotalea sanaruensis]
MMEYKCLTKQQFYFKQYAIVPIRMEDRFSIMQWRNEQMYHLRQNRILTPEDQDQYFKTVVAKLFDLDKPGQILFSYLDGDTCIGYGGLVHIDWTNRNAEISFIMDTTLEKEFFEFHWSTYLSLIERVAFEELDLHKIFTYAFNLRPHLYPVLEKSGFYREATLKEHAFFDERFISVVIHAKVHCYLRPALLTDAATTFRWATNPKVREFALNQSEIQWLDHKMWFANKLKSNHCFYYLLMQGDEPIGSIRFDIDTNEAMISYLLDPKYHGMGFGRILLKKGIEQFKQEAGHQITRITGWVINENLPSVKVFENLGFEKSQDDGTKSNYYLSII